MFLLKLLGEISLEGESGYLGGRAVQRHRLALLALLAASRSVGPSRDRLIAFLWPDADAARGRALLSNSIYVLRQALGENAILVNGEALRLNPEFVETDTLEFERALEQDDRLRAVQLYRGPFMSGFSLPDAFEFERWADGERERFGRSYARALESLAREQEGAGDFRSAALWWRRLAAHDPYSSRITLRLMQALAAAGEHAGAIQHARIHEALLREELEAAPDPEITSLAAQLRERRRHDAIPLPAGPAPARPQHQDEEAAPPDALPMVPASPRAVSEPIPLRRPRLATFGSVTAVAIALAVLTWGMQAGAGEPSASPASAAPSAEEARGSIAVLPFADLSPTEDREYFADGLAEELTQTLGRVGGLRVAARTSAFAFKGIKTDVREIGRRLGVAYALEGSIRQERDTVRVTVQLISTNDGYSLWSRTYQRHGSAVLRLQEQIAREIVAALRTEKVLGSERILPRQQTSDAEAYRLYLQGRYLWNQRTAASLAKALEFFRAAVQRDPDYALAYAALADTYIILGEYQGIHASQRLPLAVSNALRAIALDPTLAEPHAALAKAHDHAWQWDAAEQEYRRALDLNPGYATAYHWYSMHLRIRARPQEALATILRAKELDPLSLVIRVNVADTHLLLGDVRSAVAEADEMIALQPNAQRGYFVLGQAYLHAGRNDEAVVQLERALALGGEWRTLTALGEAYARAGRRGDALDLLRRMDQERGEREFRGMGMAIVHTALGDRDEAFRWLEREYEARSGGLPNVRWEVSFKPLWSDPRYSDLLRRMGLEPG